MNRWEPSAARSSSPPSDPNRPAASAKGTRRSTVSTWSTGATSPGSRESSASADRSRADTTAWHADQRRDDDRGTDDGGSATGSTASGRRDPIRLRKARIVDELDLVELVVTHHLRTLPRPGPAVRRRVPRPAYGDPGDVMALCGHHATVTMTPTSAYPRACSTDDPEVTVSPTTNVPPAPAALKWIRVLPVVTFVAVAS